MDIQVFRVETIMGAKTGKGLVQIHYLGKMLQVTPAEARDMALNLLRGAEAAEIDEAVWTWAQDEETGMMFLRAMREARETLEEGALT